MATYNFTVNGERLTTATLESYDNASEKGNYELDLTTGTIVKMGDEVTLANIFTTNNLEIKGVNEIVLGLGTDTTYERVVEIMEVI